jgi:hypothetical protein
MGISLVWDSGCAGFQRTGQIHPQLIEAPKNMELRQSIIAIANQESWPGGRKMAEVTPRSTLVVDKERRHHGSGRIRRRHIAFGLIINAGGWAARHKDSRLPAKPAQGWQKGFLRPYPKQNIRVWGRCVVIALARRQPRDPCQSPGWCFFSGGWL